MNLAREAGLDLVEVSPMERPPVCRIMDFGKHQYERKKRQKNAAGGHVIILKEIRLRPKTDDHDRSVKMKRAKGFLEEGHKVQFTMLFRGRERAHRDRALQAFRKITEELGEEVKVERFPAMEGRRMTMVVTPAKLVKKTTAPAARAAPAVRTAPAARTAPTAPAEPAAPAAPEQAAPTAPAAPEQASG